MARRIAGLLGGSAAAAVVAAASYTVGVSAQDDSALLARLATSTETAAVDQASIAELERQLSDLRAEVSVERRERRLAETELALALDDLESIERTRPEPAVARAVTAESKPAEVPPAVSDLGPDPATVRQTIRRLFAERLDREPEEQELRLLTDWYLGEHSRGGDTAARLAEHFDVTYAGELRSIERSKQASGTGDMVRRSTEILSEMSRGDG